MHRLLNVFVLCIVVVCIQYGSVCASHLPRMASFISDTKLQLPELMLHIATLKADKYTAAHRMFKT